MDDEQFRNDFEIFRQECTPKGKRIIRYVLCGLERQHSEDDLSWYATDATIEHVLPEQLDATWEETFSDDDHVKYVDRLGTYALLEKGKNREVGQKPFTEKKAVFEKSQYALTREISQFDDWNKDAISQRQKRLAKLAVTVWKFPS